MRYFVMDPRDLVVQRFRHLAFVVAGALLLVTPAAADQPATVKNVLLLMADDLKADALPMYGNEVCQTPHLDALAKRGMVFDRAYCQGTWCAPSRQSMMYSRYRDNAGKNWGEHFREHDYYTARVGKIFHMRVPGDIIAGTNGADVASTWTERFNSPGLEAHTPGHYACLNLNEFTTELQGRQSTRMPHRMFVTVRYEGDGSDQPDAKSAARAIELLREHRDDPFFLAVGMVRPHYPNVAPQSFFDRYPWQPIKLPTWPADDAADIPKLGLGVTLSWKNRIGRYPENQQRMWAGYYATVTFLDQQIGRILAELRDLGLDRNTAVIFTSDHGYFLGEHGFWQKSNFHEEVARVPLVIATPGLATGRTSAFAELVDLYPTAADLVGLPAGENVQGRSLRPVLEDPQARVRDAAVSLDRGSFAVRTDGWAYMRYRDGSEELYDMRRDPQQFTNLAGTAEHAKPLRKLRRRLDAFRNDALNSHP